jgi:hypothetical protein
MSLLGTQKNLFLVNEILKMHVISTILAKELTQMPLGPNNILKNIKLLHVSDLSGPSSGTILFFYKRIV